MIEGEQPVQSQPYDDSAREEMILRDHLAAARTVLANERTLLAYIRTALAMVAAGAGLIEFATAPWMQFVGWALTPTGAVCIVVGAFRYLQFKRYIKDLTVHERRV